MYCASCAECSGASEKSNGGARVRQINTKRLPPDITSISFSHAFLHKRGVAMRSTTHLWEKNKYPKTSAPRPHMPHNRIMCSFHLEIAKVDSDNF